MKNLSMFGILVFVLSTVACGGGSDGGVTGPPVPQIPTVAGNYSGTTNIVFPEVGESVACPTSTIVTQSGSTVNFSPMVLGGACGGYSLPLGRTTIDNTGAIDGGSTTGTSSADCGTYTYTGSGGFFGRDLRVSLNYTSRTCLNMNITMTLTR
jgi:hypothetical protein